MTNNEIVECKDIEKLKIEIQKREELLAMMVGSLYPSIVRDEILLINTQIDKLRKMQ